MSSGFFVPEVLALAISLAVAPGDASTAESPGAFQANRSAAVAALAQFQKARHADWSQFRFKEQAWLRAVKDGGNLPRYRLLAARIFKTRAGSYYVPIDDERRRIFDLRRNLKDVFLLTVNECRKSAALLQERLARRPAASDLFLAQRLGLHAAARLIELAEKKPDALAAAHFPKLAFDNPKLFFGGRKPRSARALYKLAMRRFAQAAGRAMKTQHHRGGKDGWLVAARAKDPAARRRTSTAMRQTSGSLASRLAPVDRLGRRKRQPRSGKILALSWRPKVLRP